MELINLSAEPLGKLHSWIPRDLEARGRAGRISPRCVPREVTSADGDSRSDPPERLATVCSFGLWMRNAAGAVYCAGRGP
jgi:hypothetical protein